MCGTLTFGVGNLIFENLFVFTFFQKLRLHNIMFGMLTLVVSVVCLAMLVLLTAHE